MDYFLSLKISLDEILEKGLDYERKVMENLFRFSNYIGSKQFKVIFYHYNLEEKNIKEFISRQENILFQINTKITASNCQAWFTIQKTQKENQGPYRYKFVGSIIDGLPSFFKMVKHLKDKENAE
tara:strand:+ start:268 stop:642 length:375 start_codon:yes stop_codon:yes gene_type:complete